MTDCRRVKQLLPLWVGQDLPDSASAAEVASHLESCPDCERQQRSLQASLELLHSSKSWPVEPSRPSLWPQLVSRISKWDNDHRRERFNGWIPASVMSLAVALMVAVSIPSIHQAIFDDEGSSGDIVDHFPLRIPVELPGQDVENPFQQNPLVTPVNWEIPKTHSQLDQF